jgi:hypothetical protein
VIGKVTKETVYLQRGQANESSVTDYSCHLGYSTICLEWVIARVPRPHPFKAGVGDGFSVNPGRVPFNVLVQSCLKKWKKGLFLFLVGPTASLSFEAHIS